MQVIDYHLLHECLQVKPKLWLTAVFLFFFLNLGISYVHSNEANLYSALNFFTMIRSEINPHGICTESRILNISTTEHYRITFICGEATCTFDFEQTFIESFIFKRLC